MRGYIPIEYPKWIDGVFLQNAAEEEAYRPALAKSTVAADVSDLSRAPSSAGIRMRRTRERQREGKLSIRCDISSDQIEPLTEAGFIDPALRDDPSEVAQGVSRSLERLTRSGQGATL